MADTDEELRAFATGVTHEGRSVPPAGWALETTPGLGPEGARMPFVQAPGGALLPLHFVMHLQVPPPSTAKLRLIYETHPDGVQIMTIWANGMDAVQAVDMLRRIAPIDVWNKVAVSDLGLRLLMKQLSSTPDGLAFLTERMNLPEESARALLQAFETEGDAWPTFQPSPSSPAPVDSPQWTEALTSWRERAESGELFTTARGITTRPNVRRNRVTREHLALVAAVYRDAQEAGAPPTLAVAERFQASHSTATRWVNLARKEKLLGPAQKGKAGEIDQNDAEG